MLGLVYQKSANKDSEEKESGNSEKLVWRGSLKDRVLQSADFHINP